MLIASMVRAVGTLDLKGMALVKADASRKHSGFMHSHSQPQGLSRAITGRLRGAHYDA